MCGNMQLPVNWLQDKFTHTIVSKRIIITENIIKKRHKSVKNLLIFACNHEIFENHWRYAFTEYKINYYHYVTSHTNFDIKSLNERQSLVPRGDISLHASAETSKQYRHHYSNATWKRKLIDINTFLNPHTDPFETEGWVGLAFYGVSLIK